MRRRVPTLSVIFLRFLTAFPDLRSDVSLVKLSPHDGPSKQGGSDEYIVYLHVFVFIFIDMKVCNKCLIKKEISEFSKNSHNKDGYKILHDLDNAYKRFPESKNVIDGLRMNTNRFISDISELFGYKGLTSVY